MIIPFSSQNPLLRDQAQELVWQATDCMYQDEEHATRLCRQALDIYPDCVDAIHLLADIESKWQRDFVSEMHKAIEAGRRDLGEVFFKEHTGNFWGLFETRPFMRAMAALAEVLAENEYHTQEAIPICEEMLELNPNDNQGVRYGLLGCYLARKRYFEAQKLLDMYPEEDSAFFLWGRVLLDYATNSKSEAAETLRLARAENPYVEAYFFPRKRRPNERLGSYSPGEETEAIACAQTLHVAWKAHSPARKWLQQACAARAKPPERVSGDMHKGIEVPPSHAKRFKDIVRFSDAFCSTHLDGEYRKLCREMAAAACCHNLPIHKGRPKSWAAGIVYALGRVNFLTDPSQSPHLTSKELAERFGVSLATMQAKWKMLREGLDLCQFHPDWTLPSLMDSNPMIWILEMNGLLVDIRKAPREAQIIAFEKGIIPYVPADRQE